MEMIPGIILLITFFAFIVCAIRGGDLMLGLFVMALLWAGIGALGGVVIIPKNLIDEVPDRAFVLISDENRVP